MEAKSDFGDVAAFLVIGYLWVFIIAGVMLVGIISEWVQFGLSAVSELLSDASYWLGYAITVAPGVASILWAHKVGKTAHGEVRPR